jgi:mono/diheme cytochrome c family protein
MSHLLPRAGIRRATTLLLTASAIAFARTDAFAWADGSPVTPPAGTGNVNGAQVYEHICQGCHMAQAQGAVGAGHYPKLALNPALVSWQYVALTVLNGKNGMPGFGLPEGEFIFGAARLSDAQVAAVVNFVRSHFGNRWKDSVAAEQVAALPHPR